MRNGRKGYSISPYHGIEGGYAIALSPPDSELGNDLVGIVVDQNQRLHYALTEGENGQRIEAGGYSYNAVPAKSHFEQSTIGELLKSQFQKMATAYRPAESDEEFELALPEEDEEFELGPEYGPEERPYPPTGGLPEALIDGLMEFQRQRFTGRLASASGGVTRR